MSAPVRTPEDEALLAGLSSAQRSEMEAGQTVRVGEALLWIEPEGRVRREPVARLYYVRTARGIFRWSKIDDALVEV